MHSRANKLPQNAWKWYPIQDPQKPDAQRTSPRGKRGKDSQQMGKQTTAPMQLLPELQQKDNHYTEMFRQNRQTNYLQNNNACTLTQDPPHLLIEDSEQSETEPVQNIMIGPQSPELTANYWHRQKEKITPNKGYGETRTPKHDSRNPGEPYKTRNKSHYSRNNEECPSTPNVQSPIMEGNEMVNARPKHTPMKAHQPLDPIKQNWPTKMIERHPNAIQCHSQCKNSTFMTTMNNIFLI